MKRPLTIIFTSAFIVSALSGCGPEIYKKADLGWWSGRHGYLDKQLSPGVYIIEVAAIGGYQFINDRDGTLATMKKNWKRRASELCPNGYSGIPQVIDPIDARIAAFRCDLVFCQGYPMISGEVKCNSNGAPSTS